MSHFCQLKISKKIQETDNACSFLLDIPESNSEDFKYVPGQYLTLKVQVNGEELRRAYSIFTAPFDDSLGFTVKRVPGGKVSNYLIDNIHEGDNLEVDTPQGKFTLEVNHDLKRDHYFVAAGSGITPIISMIRSVLENEPMSHVYLLYVNRNEDGIIFNDTLNKLAENHSGQFFLRHILSQPEMQKSKGLGGLFGKKTSNWKGWKGRIDASVLQRFFDDNPSRSNDDAYYLCGPGGLIDSTQKFLETKGISKTRILREFFTNPDQEIKAGADPVASTTGDCEAEVTLNGETFTLTVPSGKTVLEAIMDLGKDAPYSCTSGACSTCMAKLSEGEVAMDACFALDDDEVASGFILTCQSRPKTSKIKLNFQA